MNTKANTWTSDKSWRSVDYIASLLQWVWRNYVQYWFIKHINVDGWIGHQFNHVAARFLDWWVPETSRRCPRPLHQVRYQTDTVWIHFITEFWLLSPDSELTYFSGKWSLGWVPDHWLRINKMLISLTKHVHSHYSKKHRLNVFRSLSEEI